MTSPMPPDAPVRIKAQAIKQDSDPAVKLRHLIQCHANPGARWTERCLELVDELVAQRDSRLVVYQYDDLPQRLLNEEAHQVSGDPSLTEP